MKKRAKKIMGILCALTICLGVSFGNNVTVSDAATKKTQQVVFTKKDGDNWLKSYVKMILKPNKKNKKAYIKESQKGINFIKNLPIR